MSAFVRPPSPSFLENEIKLVDQLVSLNKPCTPSDWEKIAEEYNYLLNSPFNQGIHRDVQTLQTVWKRLLHCGRFREYSRRRRTGRRASGPNYVLLDCLRECCKEQAVQSPSVSFPPAGNSNPPTPNDNTLKEVKTETNDSPRIEDSVLSPQGSASPQESFGVKRERENENAVEDLKLMFASLQTQLNRVLPLVDNMVKQMNDGESSKRQRPNEK